MTESAHKYTKLGLSCLPCGTDKAPAIKEWKRWQTSIPKPEECEVLFSTASIGIIGGDVSGGLEIIDVDSKYHPKGTAFNEDVLDGLDFEPLIVESISGGIHIYFRSPNPEGSMKLAGRKVGNKIEYFIETRGSGAYVIAPPSKGYKIIHGSFDKIPMLTAEHRIEWLDYLRSFNEHFEKPYKPRATYNAKAFIISPLNDYNERADVVALLEKNNWKQYKQKGQNVQFTRPGKDKGISASWHIDKRLFYIFTSTTGFESGRAYMPYQLLCEFEYSGDYSNCAKALISLGYGVSLKKQNVNIQNFIAKKRDEEVKDEALEKLLHAEFGISQDQAKDLLSGGDQLPFPKFWYTKVNDRGESRIIILQYDFSKFIHYQLGLSLYFGDNKTSVFRLILDKDGLIEECTSEMLKKRLLHYLEDELPDFFDGVHRSQLCEILVKNKELFSDKFYEFINHSDFKIMRDNKLSGHYFFKNTIVKIDKDKITPMNYDDVGKVWKNQVNNRDFHLTKPDTKQQKGEQKLKDNCVFTDFCWKLSGQEDRKYNFLRSVIGYCLHKYKDPTQSKSVVFSEEVEDSNKGGGSGKSILVKAINKIIDGMVLDGEMFDPKQPFALQRYKLGQSFIAVEDAAKKMSLKHFKSLITEGITIDKKNKDQLYLPYADAPKWIFTTNYNIGGIANYEKRRVIKFGVEPFFNINNTPDEFYGHYFFEDWDKFEWNKFFNFMLRCVQYFLKNGLVALPSHILNKKAIINGYTKDFAEFLQDYTDNRGSIGAKELWNLFLEETEMISREYAFKRFRSGLEAAVDLLDIPFEVIKDKTNKNKLTFSCTDPERESEVVQTVGTVSENLPF